MKTCLVTGGSSGIGYATCQGLVEHGFEVVLTSRDRQRAARDPSAEEGRLKDRRADGRLHRTFDEHLGDIDAV